ncbi:hypothetical protein ACFY19_06865 [Streptosporangium saharense]|uniref:Tat pathway signal sequence domain protein n=1 Tax=Streptosporangium saharense TaxID=1706840 RepID=A0A7W7QL53_9ACTN|nr:hypothetical protein [Streptosporangium saharense]MBB4915579.1 hypothetical protein [Streptosporangium saharense]
MSDLFPRRFAAVALAAALGGTLLVQPATAVAAPAAAASTATTVAPFRYEVYFPKYTYRGGNLTYTVKVRNNKVRGQHYVALVGEFSSNFRAVRVVSKPRSVRCSVKGRTVLCLISSLDKGDVTSFKLRGWVGPRRGTATVRFGAAVTSNPHVSAKRLAKEIRSRLSARSRIL